jgi:hypothetical protein
MLPSIVVVHDTTFFHLSTTTKCVVPWRSLSPPGPSVEFQSGGVPHSTGRCVPAASSDHLDAA